MLNIYLLKKPMLQRRQTGVVLAMVLILLVIISLVGSIAVRNATVSEQTVNSLRTNAVALQAAEIGLRYCEYVANERTAFGSTYSSAVKAKTLTSTLVTTANDSTAQWQNSTTWSGANVITVPNSFFKTTDVSAVVLKNAPVCIIETLNSDAGVGYVITARGFANDAVLNANNAVVSGAEVWLQSILVQ
jgi:type IV pilus assembly protein PilX